MRLPWLLLPLLLGGVEANSRIMVAGDDKEILHKRTADQLECKQHVNIERRSQDGVARMKIQDYHEDSIDLDNQPAISLQPNQTRHTHPNPETAQLKVAITDNIANPSNDPPPSGPKKSSIQHAEPPILDYDPSLPRAGAWTETRNPAPASRVIAGMGAGLVGVMVVFTVFL